MIHVKHPVISHWHLFFAQERRRLWREISSGTYFFTRRDKYAEYIATISLDDLILFYRTFVLSSSSKRRKFSSQYFGAGTKYPHDLPGHEQGGGGEGIEHHRNKKVILITDSSAFKRASALRPVRCFDTELPVVDVPPKGDA